MAQTVHFVTLHLLSAHKFDAELRDPARLHAQFSCLVGFHSHVSAKYVFSVQFIGTKITQTVLKPFGFAFYLYNIIADSFF